MRYKVAPGPVELVGADALRAAHGALPLVPEDVDDCCSRVTERTAVDDRDAAREWIAFLTALGLAEGTDRGYRRVRTDLDATALSDPFVENVFGVAELLEALDERGSLTAAAGFEVLRPEVPAWERDRHADWERVWTDRTDRLLAWMVVFDLATREGDTYRPVGARFG